MTLSRRRLLQISAPALSTATALAPRRGTCAPGGRRLAAPVSIEVKAKPIAAFDPADPANRRFGALRYRSGLVLTSPFAGFGGLSAIRLGAAGERFIAISDRGNWFTGRILYSGGEMRGLADVEAAPMLGPDGRPITARGWFDSESLALDGPLAFVGLERVNQVLRFDFSEGVAQSRGTAVPLPPRARTLPYNQGLEAMVLVPAGWPRAGTLIAISERGLDSDGNLIAFLIFGPAPGELSVRRTGNFDVSDAVLLGSGDVLVLERKLSLFHGLEVRIRRIALETIVPGAVVDGPTIFKADLFQEIDNMEGLDAHVSAEGDTVLTMVSDDNFSSLQRTLILQFTLEA